MKKIGITTGNIRVGEFYFSSLSGYNVDAVRDGGALPIIIPTSAKLDLAEVYIESIDGLVITGGSDISPFLYGKDPVTHETYDFERDSFELALFKLAMEKGIPILCICRGLQLANVARGGSLIRDLKKAGYDEIIHVVEDFKEDSANDSYHIMEVDRESRLYSLLGGEVLLVNSVHHQAINDLGENMKAVAWSKDGVIEAVEMTDYEGFYGFQFHPERLYQKEGFANIYKDFVGRA